MKKISIDKSICLFIVLGMARTSIRSTRRISRSFGNMTVRPAQMRTVRDSGVAYSLLHPIRRRILESLQEPDSAAGLTRRLRAPRQVLNYHVKEMARAGCCCRREGGSGGRFLNWLSAFGVEPEKLSAFGTQWKQGWRDLGGPGGSLD